MSFFLGWHEKGKCSLTILRLLADQTGHTDKLTMKATTRVRQELIESKYFSAVGLPSQALQ